MSIADLHFDKTFKISTIASRICRSHPDIPRNTFWKMQFTFIMGMAINVFCLLINSIINYDIKAGKYTDASKNGIMVIVSITITTKYIVLLYYEESIKSLIKTVNNDYELAKEFPAEYQEIVLKYAQKGVKVCKIWLYGASATSSIFPVKAFILMGYYYYKGEFRLVPMFDYTYPSIIEQYKSEAVVFWLLFFVCLFFDVYATLMHISFDPMAPIFMLHACGQIEVVNCRIMKVFADSKNEAEVRENLRAIITKLQEIYKFIDIVKADFTMLYEYNMKTTTFLMPLTAFQIADSLRHGVINIEFMSFLYACILHFYVPCYYSDLLMDKSDSLRAAIYSSNWETYPDAYARNMILIMLTRTIVPLVINTVFYPICLDTFAEMCRQSYAIFNIMNAAWA